MGNTVAKLTADYNLGNLHPDLVKEWNATKNKGLAPYQITPGSGRKVWWKCIQGHEWEARVYSRARNGSNCPYCLGRKATKDNNLAIKYPELAKEWHSTRNEGLTSYDVTLGSDKKKSGGSVVMVTNGNQKCIIEIMEEVILTVPEKRFMNSK